MVGGPRNDCLPTESVAFVEQLAVRFPTLAPMLAEHAADNFGEILPHVFFGDVTRYVLSLALSSDTDDGVELREIVRYLEEVFASCEHDTRGVISASFLWNLPESEDGVDV